MENNKNAMWSPRGSEAMDVLDLLSSLSNDEVFTPPKIAREMIDLLGDEIWERPDLPDMRFLDPACKTGVFLRELARKLIPALMRHPRFEEYSDNHDVMGNTRPEVEMPWLSVREHFVRKHVYTKMLYGIAISKLTAMISKKTLYLSKDANSGRHCITKGWFKSEDGNIWNPWGYVETGEFDEEWGKPISRYEQKIQHTPAKPGGSKCQHCGANISNFQDESKDNHAYAFIHRPLEEIFPHLKNEEGKVVFDVIIGNPPYQLSNGGGAKGNGAMPIYQLFVERASRCSKLRSFIIPSRWLSGGAGLSKFRKEMFSSRSIKKLVDFENSADCFSSVRIAGGVCYFIQDNEKHLEFDYIFNGKRSKRSFNRDVFVRNNLLDSIIEKVCGVDFIPFSENVLPSKPFGLRGSFSEYSKKYLPNSYSIYGRGYKGYVEKKYINKNIEYAGKFKILISNAYTILDGKPHQVIGKPILCEKDSVCTETYIVLFSSDSREECLNALSYISSKFFRALVSSKRIGQIIVKDKFDFVPNLDFDKSWCDEELYSKYDLSREEIEYIEFMIKDFKYD